MYIDGDRVVNFNLNYCVCGDRDALKEFALKMKRDWILEIEKNLRHLEK